MVDYILQLDKGLVVVAAGIHQEWALRPAQGKGLVLDILADHLVVDRVGAALEDSILVEVVGVVACRLHPLLMVGGRSLVDCSQRRPVGDCRLEHFRQM